MSARSIRSRAGVSGSWTLAALVALAGAGGFPLEAQGARTALFAEPSPSPDGREIAFVSGGDIWVVARAGGDARLLVADAANDFRPRWSPDGAQLAFVSTRTGNGDIYVLDLATNATRRLTFEDGLEQLDAWSPDGAFIYFSSTSRDIAGMNDVMRVRATGGTPMAVAGDRYASEYFASPAPDGRRVAVTARGITAAQWWRRGSSHIDEAEIWTVTLDETPRYVRLSTGQRPGKGRDVWPMWARDGATIYFVSDRTGTENLYAQSAAGGDARALSSFSDGRVLWPQLSADGATILFERDFQIWSLTVADGLASPIPITLRGAAASAVAERLTLNAVQAIALSPDAKKLALVARGEIFAADAKEGGEATRVTTTAAPEGLPAWAPDSRRLAYTSWRDGTGRIYLYDFGSRTERALTTGGDDLNARWSPDGKTIAFTRDGTELRVVDPATGTERLVTRALDLGRVPFVPDRNFVFSPDGSHLAFMATGDRGFLHASVVPISGGEATQVSFLSNAFGGDLSWSPDARTLYFVNAQRTEDGQVIRVDLVPRVPTFREAKFDALFPAESAATSGAGAARGTAARGGASNGTPGTSAAGAVRIVAEGLLRRATALDVNVNVGGVHLSPDGKTLAIEAGAAGQFQLWTWSVDESATEAPQLRQITSSSGGKGNVVWSPDSKDLWYLSGGRVQVVGVENRSVRAVAVSASLDTEFTADRGEVFRQVWGWTRDNFYDAEMHGVDWDAVRTRYAPVVNASRTPEEMRRALGLMIGELNASHSGVGGPTGSPPSPTGRLGVDFERVAAERDGALKVRAVLPLGPAALAGSVAVGDFILAVNGTPVAGRNLDSLLTFTVGRRVMLRVASTAEGRGARDVAVQPISTGAEKGLRYRTWVDERRAYVERMSGGRFGYVHMLDMGAGSLAQLYVDIDAANHGREGVVIDIRNNNGGFVNAYALDVFSRRPYLSMERRGSLEVPARLQLGQRAFEKPTVLVINQHSLSDAEDFTVGYRALGLGPVVGEPTSGWIIYTSNFTLFDGTSLRVPFIRIRDAAGEDMELVPRPVDVRVDRPMGEAYGPQDVQLDAAIAALRERLRTP
jgi:Tol biopolymer transport system component/C-terminal processing protease CtpA/Prc